MLFLFYVLARKLSIYQLLEPNSFLPTVTYVPILKKEIRAHVYDVSHILQAFKLLISIIIN